MLSIEKKIELFEQYFKECDEPITGNTIYKGYNLGQMAINIRATLKKNKNYLTDEQYRKLDEFGILEKQKMPIELKIEKVLEFVQKYPQIWYGKKRLNSVLSQIKTNAEKEQIKQNLKKVENYYFYLVERYREGLLKEEDITRLREGGVRRGFGYESSVQKDKEKYVGKYGIDEKIFDSIIRKYDTFENFREVYIQALVNNNVKNVIPNNILTKVNLITDFDLSSSDLVKRKNKYIECLKDIFGEETSDLYYDKSELGFFDGKKIQKVLEELFKEFPERTREIISKYYGFEGNENQSYRNLSDEYETCTETIRSTKLKAFAKIRSNYFDRLGKLFFCLNKENKEIFLKKYFELHDIFYAEEEGSLDDDKREALLEELIFLNIKEKSKIDEFSNKYLSDFDSKNYGDLDFEVRENARKISENISSQIEENDLLSEKSKKNLYKRFAVDTDYIRLIIESGIPYDGTLEFYRVNNFFEKTRQTICNIFENDNNNKNKYLEMLENRRKFIIQRNKQFVISCINGEPVSEMIVTNPSEIFETRLEDLGISIRSCNCLNKCDGKIKTVYDYSKLTLEQKNQIANFGKKSIEEVDLKMLELGFESKENGSFEFGKSIRKVKKIVHKDTLTELAYIRNTILEKYFDEETRERLLNFLYESRNINILHLSEKNTEKENEQKIAIIQKIEKFKDDKMKLLSMPIEGNDLSVRVYNALKRASVDEIGDWMLKTEEEKKKIYGLGKKNFEEIKTKIDGKYIAYCKLERSNLENQIRNSNLSLEEQVYLMDLLNSVEPEDKEDYQDDAKQWVVRQMMELENLDLEEDVLTTELFESIKKLKASYNQYKFLVKRLAKTRERVEALLCGDSEKTDDECNLLSSENEKIQSNENKIKRKIEQIEDVLLD